MGFVYSSWEKARCVGVKKSTLAFFNSILRKIDEMQARTSLLSKPISLHIEPTTRCNLRCGMCLSPLWGRKGMEMSFPNFKKIIDQFPLLVTINLQGIGEPLLNKDIFKMIEYCKSKKMIVLFTTNGTLINEKVAEKFVDFGLDYIIVSIDGAVPETFEKIRIGANFNQVIENIKNLIAIRGDAKKPRVVFLFTGTSENIEELPQVLRLAKDIGVDKMEAQDTHFWSDAELKDQIDTTTLRQEMERVKGIVNKTIVEADKIGMPLSWLGSGGRKSLYTEEDLQLHADPRRCQMIFRSCFITVDGYVTTCACSPDPRKFNFGNVLEQDFDTIWNSPKYVALRKARLEGKIPEYCKMCTVPHL